MAYWKFQISVYTRVYNIHISVHNVEQYLFNELQVVFMRPKARSVGHDDRPGPRNGQLFVHDEKQAVPGPTATLGAATSTRWPTVRIIVDPGVDRAGCHPELSLPAEAVREGGSRDLG